MSLIDTIEKIAEVFTGGGGNPNEEINNRNEGGSEGNFGNVRPASEDPLGDPADGNFGNVRPASEDPLGDPADQQNGGGGNFGNVLPASRDPLGDPADR